MYLLVYLLLKLKNLHKFEVVMSEWKNRIEISENQPETEPFCTQ